MSSDDFYIIRLHPKGGYAAVHDFATRVDRDLSKNPEARDDHIQFKTLSMALDYALSKYPEYGVSVHEECYKKHWWARIINAAFH